MWFVEKGRDHILISGIIDDFTVEPSLNSLVVDFFEKRPERGPEVYVIEIRYYHLPVALIYHDAHDTYDI